MSAPAQPTTATPPAAPQPPSIRDATGSPYAWYVLGVLVVVYVFNFLDRQILSILAERIKHDLDLSDAQIGSFVGLALGPYSIGRLSVALGSLRAAMLWGLCVNALALLFGALATRHLARDESSKLERARAAGEPNL